MSKTKERISYDASICAIVDICGLTLGEKTTITFENEEDWDGDFELTVYNSEKKNTKNIIENSITVDGVFMDVELNPDDQEFIDGGTYFYEIFDNTSERVIFKGNLILNK